VTYQIVQVKSKSFKCSVKSFKCESFCSSDPSFVQVLLQKWF